MSEAAAPAGLAASGAEASGADACAGEASAYVILNSIVSASRLLGGFNVMELAFWARWRLKYFHDGAEVRAKCAPRHKRAPPKKKRINFGSAIISHQLPGKPMPRSAPAAKKNRGRMAASLAPAALENVGPVAIALRLRIFCMAWCCHSFKKKKKTYLCRGLCNPSRHSKRTEPLREWRSRCCLPKL